MSRGRPPRERLHLPDLRIAGFRGIDALTVPRLGRVTLFAGKNGVGKTTVLEACRIYAARGRYSVLSELAARHEEYSATTDEDGDKVDTPNLAALFHGRDISRNGGIEIGPDSAGKNRLKIEMAYPNEEYLTMLESLLPEDMADSDLRVVKTVFRGREHVAPWPSVDIPRRLLRHPRSRRFMAREEPLPAMECGSLGPGLIRNDEIAAFWDGVALTPDEILAVKALQLVLDDAVERVAMVGEGFGGRHRRVIVKLADHDRPVPLKSLGDGATRLFGVALALANSRDGFLLIDEAENGIHHAVHRDYWRVILRTARANNVQVLATTHGWDCIKGFAQAAVASQDADGILVRLERENERVRAVEYSESELETAAEQGIEVR